MSPWALLLVPPVVAVWAWALACPTDWSGALTEGDA